ncbi:MAG: iron-containing alcohol dehydrogenase [Coriobacteriales bacterium]|jgi:alcohol dehydrogenase
MIEQFVYDMPTRVLFGAGSLEHLHEEKLPGKHALIVISSGGSMKRHGQLAAVEAQLDKAGVSHILYDGLRPNPTDTSVDEAAGIANKEGCDFIVGVGGGSTMDAAKAVALVAGNSGKCWDYSPSSTGGKKTPENPPLPLVVVTTSAGTGSEVDEWSVITNDATGEKTGYRSMFPTIAVVDSDLMMSVPANFTAYQGMDAFFHAAESMININEHVVGEMFAMKAIELIAKYLPRAVANGSDREARSYMATANTLAGYYMLCTSEHTIEHAMGSRHPKLVHGAGLIMISHEYFDFFAERKACEEQMVKMARIMGHPEAKTGKDFIAALDELIEAVGCSDLKMSDNGIEESELPGFVDLYHKVWGGNNDADPLKLTDEDVLGMLQRSYK